MALGFAQIALLCRVEFFYFWVQVIYISLKFSKENYDEKKNEFNLL